MSKIWNWAVTIVKIKKLFLRENKKSDLYQTRPNQTFTAWKHTEETDRETEKKCVMISWGFVIPAVQNNSLNDSTYIAFFRAYLDII